MKYKVTCAVCGLSQTIEVFNGRKPLGNWFYFGRININSSATSKYYYELISWDPLITKKISNSKYDRKAKAKYIEYWEHKRCPKLT
ncbi:MAG: hypothetical protein ABSD68_03390 [Candidatus Micrarchaeales archaeon]|jgi:hypothetical protein